MTKNNGKMPYSSNGAVKNSQSKRIREDQSFDKMLQLLVGELRALLTCPEDYWFFKRLLSRTIIMLKKERSLSRYWKDALEYNRKARQERTTLLNKITKIRKELRLDDVCPSLIGKTEIDVVDLKDVKGFVIGRFRHKTFPDEFSVKWIGELQDWLLDQFDGKCLEEKKLQLFTLTTQWGYQESHWYTIGRHPVITLALLECLCECVNFLFHKDTWFLTESHLGDAIDLRREVELIVTNLSEELPILKSWGKFSVDAVDWKKMVTTEALAIWNKNKTMSRAEVSRLVYPLVKHMGIRNDTVYKYLYMIDPRTTEVKKQSQKRQKTKFCH